QNDQHKTTVCAYSLRARERPTVSCPVTWAEVESCLTKDNPELLVFDAAQVLERAQKLGDLFEPVLELKQKLPKVEMAPSEVAKPSRTGSRSVRKRRSA